MPDQDSAHVLVLASRRRRAGQNQPSGHRLTAHLGHRVDRRVEQHSAGWLAPVYQHWEDTYQTQWIEVDRPPTGAATVDLTCPNCGSLIRVLVRSRSLILRYYLLVALSVALSLGAGWMISQDASLMFGGALVAFYLTTFREILGESHYHSALQIVRESRAGHWLFGPNEVE